MPQSFVIAIDGPVASGKGTLAPILAQRLNGFYLYTGATYRSIALYCIQNNIDLFDEKAVKEVLTKIHISFKDDKIFLNDRDVTERIRERDTASGSARVSALESVRKYSVALQQKAAQKEIKKGKIVVAEGRDTGTKVFRDATVKIFLTAKDITRAKRRLKQYHEKGRRVDFKKVLDDTRDRDERDTKRKIDPLVTDPEKYGYFVVDNSNQTENETIAVIIKQLEKGNLI